MTNEVNVTEEMQMTLENMIKQGIITEEEFQKAIETMDLEEMKKLQEYIKKYMQTSNLLNTYKQNLARLYEKMEKATIKPTERQIEINADLDILRKLPKQSKYAVDAHIDENKQLTFLSVDGKALNINPLNDELYLKLLMDKKYNPLYVIIPMYFVLGVSAGILNFSLIQIALTYFVASTIFSAIEIQLNKREKPVKTISNTKKLKLVKALKEDYQQEKEKARENYNNNLLFNDSKMDIFEHKIDETQDRLEVLETEIIELLNGTDSMPEITEEIETPVLVQKGRQKTYKKA